MTQINHPVFGALEITHDVPEVNMHWWEGSLIFPPTSESVILDLHAVPTGPNDLQTDAYMKLLQNYATLLECGVKNGDVTSNSNECRLAKITFFVHGHIDLHFDADDNECLIHADADAEYMTPDEAMEH